MKTCGAFMPLSGPFADNGNRFFVPLTSTGEHPKPTSGLMALRRLSSSLNQSAHSGTTGNPNRCAMCYNTNVAS
jgi:hypothetical protein